jgi:hypothetical protein
LSAAAEPVWASEEETGLPHCPQLVQLLFPCGQLVLLDAPLLLPEEPTLAADKVRVAAAPIDEATLVAVVCESVDTLEVAARRLK